MKLRRTTKELPTWGLPAGILGILVLYNISTIVVDGVSRWAEMLIVLALIGYLCFQYAVSTEELGLLRRNVRSGLRWGLYCVAAIVVVLGVVYIVRPQTFIDSRYDISWLRAVVTMFVIIPLQTVLFEEFVFRGALFASMRRVFKDIWAIAVTSIAFGLWHIVPSLHIVSSSETLNQAGALTTNPQLSVIAISVLGTTVAGVFLCWLRLRSNSLIAPILTHWAINATSVAFVVAAYARLN